MITRDQFTSAMHAAVAERGQDFVYPKEEPGWRLLSQTGIKGCRYVREDVMEPACLIGVALSKCGVPLTQLRGMENAGAYQVLGALGFADTVVRSAASEAQQAQDAGGTWGAALIDYMVELNRAR